LPTAENLLLFIVATSLANVCPGPSMMYVMSRSIGQGRIAGLWSAFGLATGLLVHTIAASLGLSTIFIYSPIVYTVVKYVGASYLLYLGISLLRTKTSFLQSPAERPTIITSRRLYIQGVFTELLNPKTALFFISFFPQFIDQARGSVGMQMWVLGIVFIIIGISRDLAIVFTGSVVSKRLMRYPLIQKMQQWLIGTVLIGLGIRLVMSEGE
jgi:threonine/homoserine/homoserine lactone efflux protein